MSNTVTLQTLQDRYGYDLSAISRWQNLGLDLTWPEAKINKWIVDTIITPLRKGDSNLKNEKLVEEIRLTKAKADQQEIDTMKASGELVLVQVVADELSRYCLQLKNAIRTIPINVYLELAEIGDDPIMMRNLLTNRIDEVLEELGNMKYEEYEPEQTEDIEDTPSGESGNTSTEENKSE